MLPPEAVSKVQAIGRDYGVRVGTYFSQARPKVLSTGWLTIDFIKIK